MTRGARGRMVPAADLRVPFASPRTTLRRDEVCRECAEYLEAGFQAWALRPPTRGLGSMTVFCSDACRRAYIEAEELGELVDPTH